jgi:hypothetical protein
MRRRELMTAAGVSLAGLGVLVGMAIGSGGSSPVAAPRTPPVEVRTEVIRKTVNVYRKAKPPAVSGTGPSKSAGRSPGVLTANAATGSAYTPRTRASGASAAAPAYSSAPTVTTRSSGTRASSPSSSEGTSRPVSTKSSGAGGGQSGEGHGGGGHDD